MLKDRGTIKWTSLMLPEHVERLKKMWEKTEKIAKPILDQQELEWINTQLLKAYRESISVILSIYQDGLIEEIRGIITAIKTDQQQLIIRKKDDTQQAIAFDQVVSIQINDEQTG